MPHRVTRDNWYSMATVGVERLRQAAARVGARSFEEESLLAEIGRIEEMMLAVAGTDGDKRPELRSHLVAVHVREPLQLPEDVIEFAGAIAEVYCRWRQQLRPPS